MADLISPEYADLCRKMREIKPDWGSFGHKHAQNVMDFARECDARSILDYGSGTGSLAAHLRRQTNLLVSEYDPVFFPVTPQPADAVACVDVLEHIEPDKLDAVLDHLWSLTRKGLFLTIALRKARAVLPDGRNAHLIVQNYQWWLKKLDRWNANAKVAVRGRAGDCEMTLWLKRLA